MGKLRLSVLLLAVLVFGCAISEKIRMDKFSEASKAYGEAVVWGHYEVANLYLKDSGSDPINSDHENLKNFKVASYDVKQVKLSDDHSQVTQIVEIKYFKLDKMIVKSLRDKQLWEYDLKNLRWLLVTGLPEFRE